MALTGYQLRCLANAVGGFDAANQIATTISNTIPLPNAANTAIATVGAGVLTAAAIVGRTITRSGSTAAYSDTTDTAAAIIAALPGAAAGMSFRVIVENTVPFTETVLGGVGVTMAGETVIPGNSTGEFLVQIVTLTTVTMTGIALSPNDVLPGAQTALLNAATGCLPAGAVTGSGFCLLITSNSTPGAQLVRTAAQMLADIPGGIVGMSWVARIVNSGAGTLTLTTDAGATVTMTGTMTVPTNTFRDFIFTITGAATATVQSAGAGDI